MFGLHVLTYSLQECFTTDTHFITTPALVGKADLCCCLYDKAGLSDVHLPARWRYTSEHDRDILDRLKIYILSWNGAAIYLQGIHRLSNYTVSQKKLWKMISVIYVMVSGTSSTRHRSFPGAKGIRLHSSNAVTAWCGSWWRLGWVDYFQPEGRGFDSRSCRHVGTLDKSFTYSCLCASAWNSDTVSVL